MNNRIYLIFCGAVLVAFLTVAGCVGDPGPTRAGSTDLTLTDGFGRTVTVKTPVESVLCSGSGTLRYLVYLRGEDLIIGVDSQEKQLRDIEGRPYALIHRDWMKDLPLFGEFRGKDDPEKIIALAPDLVFKSGSTGTTYGTSGPEADALQKKTGIPVVAFGYGSLRNEAEKAEMFAGLRLMGKTIGKDTRAEEVIAYIEATMADLERRTGDIPTAEQKRVYIAGVASAGAQGIISTEPAYPPFLWVHANNVASGLGIAHVDIAKEALVNFDPEYFFIDVNTMTADDDGAIGQLKNDPALKDLSAMKSGKVYGVLPYNFYNINYETVLANAYFIGSVLYPDRFEDIDPIEKADEIYTFFLGEPVFDELNSQYKRLGFSRIPV
ncbi:MAG: iron ABC transporter substrate-binding protein [Methanocalculus sp.]|uniref:iron ABC transporter substrate-binding protein n=1 Tax=Methanocalculus sp. TaxID=2004547 RepID=UPI0027163ECA|nr:iron ABC transporter substrate-binding protein [Methanocalculus sp.]MDO9538601.1 iron ABC transporter substrate-binding protein [Methanocalculus sp.]